jgi:hypothetical protein
LRDMRARISHRQACGAGWCLAEHLVTTSDGVNPRERSHRAGCGLMGDPEVPQIRNWSFGSRGIAAVSERTSFLGSTTFPKKTKRGGHDRRHAQRETTALRDFVGRLVTPQTRMVSVAKIRLDRRKSTRLFKGIISSDISEFESHMPSHAVGLHTLGGSERRSEAAAFPGPAAQTRGWIDGPCS